MNAITTTTRRLLFHLALFSTLVVFPLTINFRLLPSLLDGRGLRGTNASEKIAVKDFSSHEQMGRDFMTKVGPDLYDKSGDLYKTVQEIVVGLSRPIVILGSWPAQQLSEHARMHGYNVPELVANDLDVFWSDHAGPEGSDISVDHGGKMKYHVDLNGMSHVELNLVEITENFSAINLLNDNDVSATAVVIEAYRESFGGEVVMKIHARPEFWEFFFGPNHIIRPINPQRCGVNTMIRVVYKAMQMGLGFDLADLDPTRGSFRESSVYKLQQMKDYPGNPFTEYQVVPSLEGTASSDVALFVLQKRTVL